MGVVNCPVVVIKRVGLREDGVGISGPETLYNSLQAWQISNCTSVTMNL